jgi:predicted peptidase
MNWLFPILLAGAQMPVSAGIHSKELELEGGSTLRYTLSIPNALETDEPVPLVLALHYGGRVTPYFGRGVLVGLVEPALHELGAIIVAPDSPGNGWANPNSERAVLALLDHITSSYRIDERRVLVTGYSMGGMGTWYLASRHPERFTAAIPMAGGLRNEEDEHLRSLSEMPIYAIHSRADTVVPLEPTESAIAKLEASSAKNVRLVVVEDVTHYDVAGFVPLLRDAVDWLREVWREP